MAPRLSKYPTEEQLQRLNKSSRNGRDSSEVVMCNILKFKDSSEYSEYQHQMSPVLKSANATILWYGDIESTVIGGDDVVFDAVALVRYPSYKAFIDMVSSEEYQKVAIHRAHGLKGQWLFACRENGNKLRSRL